MRKIASLISLLITIALCTTVYARKLELTDWLNFESVEDVQISPDGQRLVYSRQRVNKFSDSMDNEIWQMNADGQRNRFLRKGGHARWSPDGTRVSSE